MKHVGASHQFSPTPVESILTRKSCSSDSAVFSRELDVCEKAKHQKVATRTEHVETKAAGSSAAIADARAVTRLD
jgi:hypothetical protein